MIAIVTDTSSGYSRNEIDHMGLRLVSLNYSIDNRVYEERCRGENGQFCRLMRGRDCKTAQPNPQRFVDVFTELVDEGFDVLCITLSGSLSGTFSSAELAARQVGGNIRVVDSKSVNAGMHLLIDEAVNMTVGNLSLDEIAANLEIIRDKIGIVFTVESMEPLRRGGRITIKKEPNTTLNTRPILSCNDRVAFIVNARGQKARINELVSKIPQKIRRVFVMKVGENTDVTPLTAELARRFPGMKIHLRVVGPVLTVHLGEGSFGVAYLEN